MREEDVAGSDRRPADPAGLRRVFDTIGVAIALLDRQGRIADLNAAMQRAIGCPQDLLIGQPMAGAFVWGGREDAAERFAQAMAAAGRGLAQELALTGDGNWLDIVLTPLPAESGGDGGGVVMTAVDASRRMAVEARLRGQGESLRAAQDEVARAAQAKVRFLAAASHDLRQPLQTLGIYLHMIGEQTDSPRLHKLVDAARDGFEATQRLLNSLMDIATLETGVISPQLAELDLPVFLERICEEGRLEAAGKGLGFRVTCCGARVATDPAMLERIVRNLLSNALKYTHSGTIRVTCRQARGFTAIKVQDTGPGIPQDRLHLIFEDFYQIGNPERDRRKGLGLGLATVARLSRLLGYRVRVLSRPGRGAIFLVEIPNEATETQTTQTQASETATSRA